jgi:protein gp37
MSQRLKAMGQEKYGNGFSLTLHRDCLQDPLTWSKPVNVFVNSMSDLFHKDVPTEFIIEVFNVMNQASQHRFQVLTKRSERLAALSPMLPWPSNVWAGVSVENSKYMYRIDDLRKTGAHVKFLSLEPLLGPLPGLDLAGIDWVIVGGESGAGARKMEEPWVQGILAACEAANVPFFFKQWGGVRKKLAGRELNDQTYDEMPIVG